MNIKSLSTAITTMAIIIMTLFIITAMDHSRKDILAGIVLVICLLVFAITLSLRSTARQKNEAV